MAAKIGQHGEARHSRRFPSCQTTSASHSRTESHLTAASFSLSSARSSLSRSRASSGSWACLRRTRLPASSIRSMALSGRNLRHLGT